MTSVPPTQPPAAPEGDEVYRLTEAERDDLIRAFFDQDHDCAHNMTDAYRLVERIVAERVRVVEGERELLAEQYAAEVEELESDVIAEETRANENATLVHHERARAESAEVALAELVDRIKKAEPTWPRGMYGCPDDMFSRRDLRALLPGGA